MRSPITTESQEHEDASSMQTMLSVTEEKESAGTIFEKHEKVW